MKTICIASTEDLGGKTSLSIGLGKRLQQDGHVVGYIKSLSTRTRQVEDRVGDRDAEFVRQELHLEDEIADIVPVVLTPALIEETIQASPPLSFQERLEAAYHRVASGKDIVLLEGGRHPFEGALVGLASPHLVRVLDARVLAVVKYQDHLSIDRAMGLPAIYGDRLIGVVLNAVPRIHMHLVQDTVRTFLEHSGLPVLAVLPQERLLLSISVQELVDHLGGEVVCCPGQADGLIEYLMVGAMTAGSAITYFRHRPNKAVITGGDRHDVQLAALETSTRCLILTGNQHPSTVVINRAREVGVPIVVVEPDTLATVQSLEQIFGKTSLYQPKKAARFFNILQERFDFGRFYQMLDIQT